MKKFIQYTAILGAVLSVLGFGTAWAAKMNGGDWRREEIFGSSFTVFPFHHGHRWEEDGYGRAWEQEVSEAEGEVPGSIIVNEAVEEAPGSITVTEGIEGEASGFAGMAEEPALSFPVAEELKLGIGGGEVMVKTGAVSEIQVFYDQGTQEKGKDWIKVRQDDDGEELDIQVKKAAKSYVQEAYPQVLILVPADYQFRSIEVSLAAGNFQASGIKAGELDVEAVAGSAELLECTVSGGEFTCATGSIFYSGTIKGDVDGECAMGAIELSLMQKETDFNYDLQGVGGTIRVGSLELGGLAFERRIENNSAWEMDLECSTGSIMVDFPV